MRATATRSGEWWAVEAEHDGQAVFTQTRRLDQVEAMVRDAFATLDIDVAAEPIEVVPVLPDNVTSVATNAREVSKTAAAAAAIASSAMRDAVAQLRAVHLSVRDAAAVLGVSPQRISQLEGATRPSGAAKNLRKAPAKKKGVMSFQSPAAAAPRVAAKKDSASRPRRLAPAARAGGSTGGSGAPRG